MNNNDSTLFQLVIKYRKKLILLSILSIITSTIFSGPWFITPLFKSVAVLYPANIVPFGTESETEQMIQVLQSDAITDSVIKVFKLYEHYGIDSTKNKLHRSLMLEEFHENISVKKTEFESVQLEVLDKSPKVASEIANSMIKFFDLKEQQLQRLKARENYLVIKEQMDRLQHEMDSMETIVQEMRTKDGLLDYSLQTEYAMRNYLRSIADKGTGKNLDEFLLTLKNKGGKFLVITENLWRMRAQYADIKEKHDEALKDTYKKLSYSNVVVKPFPSDKKAYPIRWLIVVTSLLSTLLLAFLVIIAIENFKGEHLTLPSSEV